MQIINAHLGRASIWILLLLATACSKQMHISNMEAVSIRIQYDSLKELPPDTVMLQMIAPFKDQLEQEMSTIIGVFAEDFKKAQPESSLTNWIGDVMHSQGRKVSGRPIDFGLMNYGGIRLPNIPAGPITIGKIYELMPFDNVLTILEVPGTAVIALFELIAKKRGGFPVCLNVELGIKGGALDYLTIKGESVDPDRIYIIATSSFLADGGDDLKMLMNQPRKDYDWMIRDAIIDYVKSVSGPNQPIQAPSGGRMKVISADN
jgi:2',3'-cyclic-nucleotide 2'-phosphodiesterase (5'-nucleotidase family)